MGLAEAETQALHADKEHVEAAAGSAVGAAVAEPAPASRGTSPFTHSLASDKVLRVDGMPVAAAP